MSGTPINCRVSVIIDPKARDQSFSLRYGLAQASAGDQENVTLKFVLQGHWQAKFMAKRLQEVIRMLKPCNVQLNKLPKQLQDDVEFQETIRDVMYPIIPENFVLPDVPTVPTVPDTLIAPPKFVITGESAANPANPALAGFSEFDDYIDMQNVDMRRVQRSIATMKIHVKEYGAHPNFSDMNTEKKRRKIWNYMKSSLAIPALSLDEALYIASRLA